VRNSIGKIKLVAGAPGSLAGSIKSLIRQIPKGRVATYGQIAALAGNPRAARAVVWLLHSSSVKERLPWHRVINGRGTISLKPGYGYEEQRALLEGEGIDFDLYGKTDLDKYKWQPGTSSKTRKSMV
jgi:methylated-DNA-protein-cysteine methyltransferase-like protein